MNEQEWATALKYLIQKLEEMGAEELVQEIRTAITSRIVETEMEQTTFDFVSSRSISRELGETKTRLPLPREAFLLAFEILHIRLKMFPEISERIPKLLGYQPDDVLWEFEEQTYLDLDDVKMFSLKDLILEQENRSVVVSTLTDFAEYIGFDEEVLKND